MRVGEPGQERLALGQFLRRHRRRTGVDFRDDRRQPVAHLRPVGDRQPHVDEHTRHVPRQRVESRRLDHPVDLDVDERFAPRVARILRRDVRQRPVGAGNDGDDRVDDEVQRQALAVDFHRDRIDQERHVVVDDLDDRVRRLPAVVLDRRIEDAHPGVARLALAGEVPVRERRAIEIGRRPLGEILGIDLAEVTDDETLERVAPHRRRPGPHQPEHEVELLRPAVIRRRLHRRLRAFAWSIVPRSLPCSPHADAEAAHAPRPPRASREARGHGRRAPGRVEIMPPLIAHHEQHGADCTHWLTTEEWRRRGWQAAGRLRNALGDRAGFRDNAAFTSAGQREPPRAPHPMPGWRNW